jgi:uncharacterized protein (TIGR00725 family)
MSAKRIYQICVSGAAAGDSVKLAYGMARAVGVQVIQQGHVVLTGATKGLPYAAASAAKAAGGEHISSIGFSPAASRLAHIKKYRLPADAYDIIVYTGFEYTGRNLMLVRASEAVIMVGGRIGTLNEMTIAIEERKPIGILLGSGGMTAEVEHVLKAAKRSRSGIIFDDDPARLVKKVIEMLDERYRVHKMATSKTS